MSAVGHPRQGPDPAPRRTRDRAGAGSSVRARPAPVERLFTDVRVVLQPIVAMTTGAPVAVEALCRFDAAVRGVAGAPTSTEDVLSAAHRGGWGGALELRCLEAAIAARASLPEDCLLFVNLSPDGLQALMSANGPDALRAALTGIVVEITEHADADPALLKAGLAALRIWGARIAVDDVGSGYAGLLRVAAMRPDYVKVDREIVAGVGDSIAQTAVLEALVTLSHRLGAAVIAEGVEQLADLADLAQLDVDYAQGYAIGRPAPSWQAPGPEVGEACRAARRAVLDGSPLPGFGAGRSRKLWSLTAALASVDTTGDIAGALEATAREIGVDRIGVSVVDAEGTRITEIASFGGALDPVPYALSDFPATAAVLRSGDALEVQLDDDACDASERRLIGRLGFQSMLMVRIAEAGRVFGALEFESRAPRRWIGQDVVDARGLAEHLAPVLGRLSART